MFNSNVVSGYGRLELCKRKRKEGRSLLLGVFTRNKKGGKKEACVAERREENSPGKVNRASDEVQ